MSCLLYGTYYLLLRRQIRGLFHCSNINQTVSRLCYWRGRKTWSSKAQTSHTISANWLAMEFWWIICKARYNHRIGSSQDQGLKMNREISNYTLSKHTRNCHHNFQYQLSWASVSWCNFRKIYILTNLTDSMIRQVKTTLMTQMITEETIQRPTT